MCCHVDVFVIGLFCFFFFLVFLFFFILSILLGGVDNPVRDDLDFV